METTTFGKCILVGEHAVLRGVPAVVVPVFARKFVLKFAETGEDAELELSGEHGLELRVVFWAAFEKALNLVGRTRKDVTGRFEVLNSIPVGAGMGASAALCVAIARWFVAKGWTSEDGLLEFCRQMENVFHGESSGLDVAVVLSGQGMHYERNGDRYSVEPMWKPDWYISYSGHRGLTSECISKVKALWAQDEKTAAAIDHQMREASHDLEFALKTDYTDEVFEHLVTSINKARDCFDRWGLTEGPISDHLEMLSENGAVAVKPTGSGGGGYVLSLWRKPPPAHLRSQLISLNR